MGLFDRIKATFSVGAEKAVKNSGLSSFNNEVNIKVVENNLVNLKQEQSKIKFSIRNKEKELKSITDDLNKFSLQLEKYVAFVNDENNSESERESVKSEAKKIFEHIQDKKKKQQSIEQDITKLQKSVDQSDEIITQFEASIRTAKDNVRDLSARQSMADSTIRLTEAAEKLTSSTGDFSEDFRNETREKEAEAEVRMEELFKNSKPDSERDEIDQIVNKKNSSEEFENLFTKK